MASEEEPDASVPDERLAPTICPFMRSALKAGLLDFDGRTAPQGTLKRLLGSGLNGLGQVAGFFARRNHTTPQMPPGRYDPVNLAGSRGAHPGSSRILTTSGFDPERFAEFTARARTDPDGRRYMTAAELGSAIASSLALDPASRVGAFDVFFRNDARNSAGEFGLLLEGFGRVLQKGPDAGRRVLFVDEMRSLFDQNAFPPEWRETVASASLLGWIRTSFGLGGFGGLYGNVRKAMRRERSRSHGAI